MAKLSAADKDLLELTALEVPWSMVCGELHDSFGSVAALAQRIACLADCQLLEIHGHTGALDPIALQAEAKVHDFFEDPMSDFPEPFTLVTTERGLKSLDGRLRRQ